MTKFQYGTVKWLLKNTVTVEDSDIMSMTTYGSLLVRGWVERSGTFLIVTEAGIKAYEDYHFATGNFRKSGGVTGLSSRVAAMLHLGKQLEERLESQKKIIHINSNKRKKAS